MLCEKLDTNLDETSTQLVESSTQLDENFIIPVFEDSWNFMYKGKTNNRKQQSAQEWMANYEIIYGNINNVKIFWEVFNNVANWTDLHVDSRYAFFKDGILPSWEDPKNCDGCSYILYLNPKRMNDTEMNEIFYHVLLYLVGNNSDYHPFINGVTFERKWQGDKVIFWCNAHSDNMLDNVLENLCFKPTDCTRSTNPQNDNYKVVVKIIDHRQELDKIK